MNIKMYNDNTTKYLNEQSNYHLHSIDYTTNRFMAFACAVTIFISTPTAIKAAKYTYRYAYSNNTLVKPIEYSLENIEKYIMDNNNLTLAEKKFFILNTDVLEDNKEYVNTNWVKAVLSDIKIRYIKDKSQLKIRDNYKAYYDYKNNEIVMFDSTCFEDCDKDVLLHEFFHCVTKRSDNNEIGLMEAVNETMSSEYDNNELLSERSYPIQSLILFSLCEILDPEVFKEYHFTNDIQKIKSEFLKIIDDEQLIDNLLERINNINKYSINAVDTNKTEEYKKYVNNLREIYTIIDKYYQTKYDVKMEDDKQMMVYFDNFLFRNTKNKYDENIICKGFFNSDYIENHPISSHTLILKPIMLKK